MAPLLLPPVVDTPESAAAALALRQSRKHEAVLRREARQRAAPRDAGSVTRFEVYESSDDGGEDDDDSDIEPVTSDKPVFQLKGLTFTHDEGCIICLSSPSSASSSASSIANKLPSPTLLPSPTPYGCPHEASRMEAAAEKSRYYAQNTRIDLRSRTQAIDHTYTLRQVVADRVQKGHGRQDARRGHSTR